MSNIWEWVAWVAARLWASLVAFVASPQVWAAAAVFALLGFCAGHIDGASPVRGLRSDVARLTAERDRATARLSEATGRLAAMDAAQTPPRMPRQPATPPGLAKRVPPKPAETSFLSWF